MILFLDFGSFPASFQLPETLPLEEQIADRDGPDGAYQVGQKTAGHRVTGVFNTHTAKIYGQNIEGCIGRSLQNAAQTAHETVGAIALHGLQHHAPGTAAAQGFHERRGQTTHKVAVHAQLFHHPSYATDEHIHGARRPKDAYGHQYGHQIGDDAHGRGEAFLGSFDESVVHVYPFPHARKYENNDNTQQYHVAGKARHGTHGVLIHLSEAPNEQSHEADDSAQKGQQGRLEQVGTLPQQCKHNAGEGGYRRGKQDGNEHIGRHGGAIGRTEGENGGGNDGQSARVEHEKHYHRVGGRVLLGIEFLQLGHGFQSRRRGGIVESEHVRRYVHEHAAHGGMVLGYLREESCEDRAQQSGQSVDRTGLLSYLHDTQPQRQDARQAQGSLEGCLRGIERRSHYLLEDGRVAHQQSDDRKHESNNEKRYPNVV